MNQQEVFGRAARSGAKQHFFNLRVTTRFWVSNNFEWVVKKLKSYCNIFILKPFVRNGFQKKKKSIYNKINFCKLFFSANTSISSVFQSFKSLNKLCTSTMTETDKLKYIIPTHTHGNNIRYFIEVAYD